MPYKTQGPLKQHVIELTIDVLLKAGVLVKTHTHSLKHSTTCMWYTRIGLCSAYFSVPVHRFTAFVCIHLPRKTSSSVFPVIRIMVKRIVKLVTGQVPLAVEQKMSIAVTMDQTATHLISLMCKQYNQNYAIPLANQSHGEYVSMSQVNGMLWRTMTNDK